MDRSAQITRPMSGTTCSTYMAACSICIPLMRSASKTCHNALRCHSYHMHSLSVAEGDLMLHGKGKTDHHQVDTYCRLVYLLS